MVATDLEHSMGKVQNFMISPWLLLGHIYICGEMQYVYSHPYNVGFTRGSSSLEGNWNTASVEWMAIEHKISILLSLMNLYSSRHQFPVIFIAY